MNIKLCTLCKETRQFKELKALEASAKSTAWVEEEWKRLYIAWTVASHPASCPSHS